VLELNGPRMLTGDYLKDLRNARAVAAAHGLELPTLDLVTTAFERLVVSGGGDLDHSALLTLLEDAGRAASLTSETPPVAAPPASGGGRQGPRAN
jgi:hypothetical protein